MNELLARLRALSMLPFSRKVILALLYAALVGANVKYSLGLSDDILLGLAAVVASVILGIGVEDASKALAEAKKGPPEPPLVAPPSGGVG